MLRGGLAALAREAGFTLDGSPMLFQESDAATRKSRRSVQSGPRAAAKRSRIAAKG